MVIDPKMFDDLTRKLADAVPPGLKGLQSDLERNFHAILQSTFNKLELVTREEFEVQSTLLARTRAKLDALEKQVAALEQSHSNPQKAPQ